MPQPKLQLEVQNGYLTVRDGPGQPLLDRTFALIQLNDGSRLSTAGVPDADQTDTGIAISSRIDPRMPEFTWKISYDEPNGSLTFALSLTNTTTEPLRIVRMDVLVAPAGYRGLPATDLEVLQSGLDSFSLATPHLPLDTDGSWQAHSFTVPHIPKLGHERASPPYIFGPALPPTEAERVILPDVTLIHTPATKPLLVGFTTAKNYAGIMAVQASVAGHRLTASNMLDSITVMPGEIIESESLIVLTGYSEETALRYYASVAGAAMEARVSHELQSGWCSWCSLFRDVTENDITKNITTIKKEATRLTIDYIQIDDGYYTKVGDWLDINEKFASGMRALSDRAHAANLKALLWIAPFYVGGDSKLYADHPDWLVRDDLGNPIKVHYHWDTTIYALDTTHPDAAKWLTGVIATIVNEWGFDGIKADFLYAASIPGRRYQANCTRIQAYRAGLGILRRVLKNKHLQGCGMLFLPSVGLVDSARIGPDPTGSDSALEDHTEVFGPKPITRHHSASIQAHWWMHNSFWTNNADCATLRPKTTTLSHAQQRATLLALSGGAAYLGDDLTNLDPGRHDIAARLLPPTNRAATPKAPYYRGRAQHMELVVNRPWEEWLIAGLFNWRRTTELFTFNPADWGLSNTQPYHLFDLWNFAHTGPLSGKQAVGQVEPGGAKLFAVHRDLGRPQLLGTSLHLLGGVTEIARETWQNQTLTLELAYPGHHSGNLYVYVPDSYRLASHEVRDHIAVVPVTVSDTLKVVIEAAAN